MIDITQEYFSKGDYKVGDYFSEMYNYFVFIAKIDGDSIYYIDGTTDKLSLNCLDREMFKSKFEYSTIKDNYWISYHGNDVDRLGRIITMYKMSGVTKSDKRDLKIEEIIYNI